MSNMHWISFIRLTESTKQKKWQPRKNPHSNTRLPEIVPKWNWVPWSRTQKKYCRFFTMLSIYQKRHACNSAQCNLHQKALFIRIEAVISAQCIHALLVYALWLSSTLTIPFGHRMQTITDLIRLYIFFVGLDHATQWLGIFLPLLIVCSARIVFVTCGCQWVGGER